MVNKKLQVWLPLIFSIVLIAGMFLGYKMNNKGSSKGFFKTAKTTSLQEAVDLIKLKYVDKVNLDSIQSGAIKEMEKRNPLLPRASARIFLISKRSWIFCKMNYYRVFRKVL